MFKPRTTLILFIAASFFGNASLEASDLAKGARDQSKLADQIFVEEEQMGGKPVLRFRVTGPSALKICKFLGVDTTKESAGLISNIAGRGPAKKTASMTCLVSGASGESRFGFGFLIDKDLKTFDLESGGYR